jgi:hypothetical protein
VYDPAKGGEGGDGSGSVDPNDLDDSKETGVESLFTDRKLLTNNDNKDTFAAKPRRNSIQRSLTYKKEIKKVKKYKKEMISISEVVGLGDVFYHFIKARHNKSSAGTGR